VPGRDRSRRCSCARPAARFFRARLPRCADRWALMLPCRALRRARRAAAGAALLDGETRRFLPSRLSLHPTKHTRKLQPSFLTPATAPTTTLIFQGVGLVRLLDRPLAPYRNHVQVSMPGRMHGWRSRARHERAGCSSGQGTAARRRAATARRVLRMGRAAHAASPTMPFGPATDSHPPGPRRRRSLMAVLTSTRARSSPTGTRSPTTSMTWSSSPSC
jgi:hypothetical protein